MGRDNGGDRHPAHQVSVDVFYMDVYEVTNGSYKACVEARRCDPPENFKSRTRENYYDDPQYDLYPVIYVNWDNAKAYCGTWRGARLPTEAEWEYAARGTEGRTYPWGEDLDNTFANYNLDVGDTTEVGSYEKGKGPFGMYDMAGNVWEWVADWYDAYPGNTDSNSDFGQIWRVVRGSSFLEDGYFVRSDNRDRYLPALSNHYIGFRCARDATP
jgi:formylglycine-generating enzyme required for sulfatase activity